MSKNEIPEHVSWRVRDAWLAIPPCWGKQPYCHVDCPYYDSCWPEEEYDEDDEEWDTWYNDHRTSVNDPDQ